MVILKVNVIIYVADSRVKGNIFFNKWEMTHTKKAALSGRL